jgi:hypothetical protein
MISHVRWALGALAGLLLLPACSGENIGPVAGMLNVSLASPQGDEGAVLFTVTGGPLDTVEAVGHGLYSARIDASTLRVVVTGDLSSGIIARIRIPDDRQASHYTATVSQVAQRSRYTQRDPAGYVIALAP